MPSHALRGVMKACADAVRDDAVIACATKGIEEDSLLTMYSVLREELRHELHPAITMLSGPSFALEVARSLMSRLLPQPTTPQLAAPSVPAQARLVESAPVRS